MSGELESDESENLTGGSWPAGEEEEENNTIVNVWTHDSSKYKTNTIQILDKY